MSIEQRFVLTILTTYDRQDMVSDSIESIIGQDYPYKQVLIVSDGSTDGTDDICKSYEHRYPHIIRFHRFSENRGCANVRNWGLGWITDHAEIGYVCFLDDDDRLLPGKFSRETTLLESHPDADFTYSDCILYNAESGRERLQKPAGAGRPDDFAIEHFLTNEAKASAILYRVRAVQDRRFRQDLRFNEDSDFLQRVAIERKGVYSCEPGCWVRSHAGSKSRNVAEIHKAVLQSSLDVVNSYPSFYRAYKSLIDRRIAKIRKDLVLALLLAARTTEAREWETDPWKKCLAPQLGFFYRLKRDMRNHLCRFA
jgi:glycosyltransferase involved in cell wall biosynthesis